MKLYYIFMILALCSYLGCDSGNICIYENKNVTVMNNTAFDLTVVIRDNFNSFQVGTMQAFDIEKFNVPYGVIIEAKAANFSDTLFVNPCRQTFELIVED